MRFALPSDPTGSGGCRPRASLRSRFRRERRQGNPRIRKPAKFNAPLLAFPPVRAIQVQCLREGIGKMLALRLPAEVEERLTALAKATGRTKSFYAREAILEHLDDLEDLYLAERRLTDIRAGKTRAVPLKDVLRDYGMER